MSMATILSMESNFCDSSQRTGSQFTGRLLSATCATASPREVKVDSITSPRTGTGCFVFFARAARSAARSMATAPPREWP
ncbi:hypothetical protein D3C79_1043420 [compost metagenome]